jgi:hypothetical protein
MDERLKTHWQEAYVALWQSATADSERGVRVGGKSAFR